MKNGEFGSENKMLESIIIDPNYVVVVPQYLSCLLFQSQELLCITISTVMLKNILSFKTISVTLARMTLLLLCL